MVKAGLVFTSETRYLVRNFVVRELPYAAGPLSPEWIGQRLDLPLGWIESILDVVKKSLGAFKYKDENDFQESLMHLLTLPQISLKKNKTGGSD